MRTASLYGVLLAVGSFFEGEFICGCCLNLRFEFLTRMLRVDWLAGVWRMLVA